MSWSSTLQTTHVCTSDKVCIIDTRLLVTHKARVDQTRMYELFGSRLAAKRRDARLTQSELAKRVELSRASIANIERGQQNLPLHQAYRLAQALGLHDPHDLLPRSSTPTVAEPSKASVSIKPPKEGLTEEERQQVERLYLETSARPS